MADASREDRAPRPDVSKQQREGSRHGSQKRRTQREGTEGGQERTGGGAHRGLRGDVQDDFINGPARGPAGSYSGDDDTRERKRREAVTEATKKRQNSLTTEEGEDEGGRIEGRSCNGNGTRCS